MYKKFTIINSPCPQTANVNEQLQWLGGCLGLFNLRDKDKSRYRVFITLIQAAKRNEHLSSDAIASRLNLTRGTVIHHVNKLIEANIVLHKDGAYIMQSDNLHDLVNRLEQDVHEACNDLRKVADELDNSLGL